MTIDFLFSRLERGRAEKNKEHWRKKFAVVAKVFAVTRIRPIWLDLILKQVNREKGHANWTNRYF